MSVTTTHPAAPPRRTIVRPDVPHAVRGRFRSVKTALTGLQLALFFALPWLRWDRGGDLPGQAVLVDLPGRRMFVFGLEFWPQDLPIAVGLLVGAALALFWATTIAGRVWCGFACPQTVWSDLFFALDRLIVRLTARGRRERLLRSAAWLAVALATGFGFTAYFTDVVALPGALLTGTAPAATVITILVLTATTWVLAAFARERVCLHMCPWPRFQAALLDADSLVVTYQAWRGEPRGRKRQPLRADLAAAAPISAGPPATLPELADPAAASRGDCIDCTRCVTVCPTGVDIRDGLQMGCIGCGLCVDACNDVMGRLSRPAGLIRFDTESAQRRRSLAPPRPAWTRPKALAFALAALLALGLSSYAIATLAPISVHVEPQRNPPFVRLSDGSVRNDYALRLDHRRPGLAEVAIHIEGLPRAGLRLATREGAAAAALHVPLGRARSLDERLLITLPAADVPHGRIGLVVVFTDAATGDELARVDTYFWGPS